MVSSDGTYLTLHFYDFSLKTWRSSVGPRVGGQCGVAGLGVGGHSLVLTLTSADSVPPVSVALYDLWADEWSRPGPDRHRDKSRSIVFQTVFLN